MNVVDDGHKFVIGNPEGDELRIKVQGEYLHFHDDSKIHEDNLGELAIILIGLMDNDQFLAVLPFAMQRAGQRVRELNREIKDNGQ